MVKPEGNAADTVWLQLPDYHVVALKPGFADPATKLEQAIHKGIRAHPDLTRSDFLDVELENTWFYVRVYAGTRTVYLIAHSDSKSSGSFSSGSDSGTEQDRPDEKIEHKKTRALSLVDTIGLDARDHRSATSPQLDLLAIILGRALHDEPSFTYVIPDERERRTVLPWFFRTLAIRASQLCGAIYTTDNMDGGALWIGPGRPQTFSRVLRAGVLTAPFRLGWTSFRRCLSLSARLDEVHERFASGLHWYLIALGVQASDREHVTRRALIEPVLARADSDGLPCYVEIFNPTNLPFYKKRGFQIEGSGRIPRGPNFWALLRTPR